MTRQGQVWIKRDYTQCSGCRRCEIACSLFHEKRIWPEASRVRVFMFIPGIEIPHLCFQCDDPKCVEACPEGALSVNGQTGAINVNDSSCTACGLCIDACPGRVPHLHPDGNRIVICDLCGGDPECAKTCTEGKWNALSITQVGKAGMMKDQPRTPQELTRETGTTILGERTLMEVWDE
jgi:anaerobic carbon-monoxide dehydrogenase iron sulfur subunit